MHAIFREGGREKNRKSSWLLSCSFWRGGESVWKREEGAPRRYMDTTIVRILDFYFFISYREFYSSTLVLVLNHSLCASSSPLLRKKSKIFVVISKIFVVILFWCGGELVWRGEKGFQDDIWIEQLLLFGFPLFCIFLFLCIARILHPY